jgi:hypothetical protein
MSRRVARGWLISEKGSLRVPDTPCQYGLLSKAVTTTTKALYSIKLRYCFQISCSKYLTSIYPTGALLRRGNVSDLFQVLLADSKDINTP